jgi:signal peptidase II
VVVLDQATKYLAETLLVMHQPVPVWPSFNLMLTYNTGAAFSFLADAGGWQRWFFLGLGSCSQHRPDRLAEAAQT